MKDLWRKVRYFRLLKISAAVFLGALSAHAEENSIQVLDVPTDSNKVGVVRAMDAYKAGTAVYATNSIIKKMPTRETLINLKVQQQLDDRFKTNQIIHTTISLGPNVKPTRERN